MKKNKNFRLGGIQEIAVLSIFLSVGYLGLAVMLNLPLVKSDVSEVFVTFFLLVPSFFLVLLIIEIFWFERDLKWNGRKKKK